MEREAIGSICVCFVASFAIIFIGGIAGAVTAVFVLTVGLTTIWDK